METEYLLPCSKQPATFLYLESEKLSLHHPNTIMLLFGDTSNVILNKFNYIDALNTENCTPFCGSTSESEKAVRICNILQPKFK